MPPVELLTWHWIFVIVKVPIMLTKKLFWLSATVRAGALVLSAPAM
jgi:hypothetical protein